MQLMKPGSCPIQMIHLDHNYVRLNRPPTPSSSSGSSSSGPSHSTDVPPQPELRIPLPHPAQPSPLPTDRGGGSVTNNTPPPWSSPPIRHASPCSSSSHNDLLPNGPSQHHTYCYQPPSSSSEPSERIRVPSPPFLPSLRPPSTATGRKSVMDPLLAPPVPVVGVKRAPPPPSPVPLPLRPPSRGSPVPPTKPVSSSTSPVQPPVQPPSAPVPSTPSSRSTTSSSSSASSSSTTSSSTSAVSSPPSDASWDSDYVTRCICDMLHDDGFMIACDSCNVWQHVVCMDLQPEELKGKYYCEMCEPRAVDRERAVKLQLHHLKKLKDTEPATASSKRRRKRQSSSSRESSPSPIPRSNRKSASSTTSGPGRGHSSSSRRRKSGSMSSNSSSVAASKREAAAAKVNPLRKNGLTAASASVLSEVATGSSKRSKTLRSRQNSESSSVSRKLKVKSVENGPIVDEARGNPSMDDAADKKIVSENNSGAPKTFARSKLKGIKEQPSRSSPRRTLPSSASNGPSKLLDEEERKVENGTTSKVTEKERVRSGSASFTIRAGLTRVEHLSEYGGKTLVAASQIRDKETIVGVNGKHVLMELFEQERPPPEQTPYVVRYVCGDTSVCVDLENDLCDAKWIRRSCRPNAKVTHAFDKGNMKLLVTARMNIDRGVPITIAHDNPWDKTCACLLGESCGWPNREAVIVKEEKEEEKPPPTLAQSAANRRLNKKSVPEKRASSVDRTTSGKPLKGNPGNSIKTELKTELSDSNSGGSHSSRRRSSVSSSSSSSNATGAKSTTSASKDHFNPEEGASSSRNSSSSRSGSKKGSGANSKKSGASSSKKRNSSSNSSSTTNKATSSAVPDGMPTLNPAASGVGSPKSPPLIPPQSTSLLALAGFDERKLSREEKKIMAYERAFEQMERAQKRQSMAKQRRESGDPDRSSGEGCSSKKRQRSADDASSSAEGKGPKSKTKRRSSGIGRIRRKSKPGGRQSTPQPPESESMSAEEKDEAPVSHSRTSTALSRSRFDASCLDKRGVPSQYQRQPAHHGGPITRQNAQGEASKKRWLRQAAIESILKTSNRVRILYKFRSLPNISVDCTPFLAAPLHPLPAPDTSTNPGRGSSSSGVSMTPAAVSSVNHQQDATHTPLKKRRFMWDSSDEEPAASSAALTPPPKVLTAPPKFPSPPPSLPAPLPPQSTSNDIKEEEPPIEMTNGPPEPPGGTLPPSPAASVEEDGKTVPRLCPLLPTTQGPVMPGLSEVLASPSSQCETEDPCRRGQSRNGTFSSGGGGGGGGGTLGVKKISPGNNSESEGGTGVRDSSPGLSDVLMQEQVPVMRKNKSSNMASLWNTSKSSTGPAKRRDRNYIPPFAPGLSEVLSGHTD
ncbi:unnamed protein product [Cyprideis torosa]|uniref:Uncharacterized protein n=1 Tax=Cyprideis torosa TaxID=163714 RepID=A0A7R8ZJE4_9CRUS|nr:unnamed protein product [Cyprideis torosa]CAG0888437.1 unnamed protein product [Cyprideis torosa]